MQLETYISDLLYRYECVTILEFGSFLTQRVSATINDSTNAFLPHRKWLPTQFPFGTISVAHRAICFATRAPIRTTSNLIRNVRCSQPIATSPNSPSEACPAPCFQSYVRTASESRKMGNPSPNPPSESSREGADRLPATSATGGQSFYPLLVFNNSDKFSSLWC